MNKDFGISEERTAEIVCALSKIDADYITDKLDDLQAAVLIKEVAKNDNELLFIIAIGERAKILSFRMVTGGMI